MEKKYDNAKVSYPHKVASKVNKGGLKKAATKDSGQKRKSGKYC